MNNVENGKITMLAARSKSNRSKRGRRLCDLKRSLTRKAGITYEQIKINIKKEPRDRVYLDRYDECVEAPVITGDQKGYALIMSQMPGSSATAART